MEAMKARSLQARASSRWARRFVEIRRRFSAGAWPLATLIVVVVALVIAVLALLRNPPPSLLPGGLTSPVDRASKIAAFRSALIQLTIAIGAAIALIFTARTYQLTRRGQVTDRFTKALERLASSELYVRIGGVRSLEQIMNDTTDHHNDTIEVLGAFVKQKCSERRATCPPLEPPASADQLDPPPADVQAALDVLTRRLQHGAPELLSFAGQNLAGARLVGARLDSANFESACLYQAKLAYTSLTDAILVHADLRQVLLSKSDLRRAQLSNAHLNGAQLVGANLTGAMLDGADLADADVTDAEFSRPSTSLSFLQMILPYDAQPSGSAQTDLSKTKGLSLSQL
jgi:hypothetical protein